MPGQTVLENDDAYTTLPAESCERIVGSPSPSKRIEMYGSSSKIVKSCSPASESSVSRLPALSVRSEEHTSELQSQSNLVCRLLLEKKKKKKKKEKKTTS